MLKKLGEVFEDYYDEYNHLYFKYLLNGWLALCKALWFQS